MQLIVSVLLALGTTAPEVEFRQREVALTYLQLYGWTEHQEEAKAYERELKQLVYLDIPTAIEECGAGEIQTDVDASVQRTMTAFNEVLLPVLTLPGELALVREHAQATKRLLDAYEAAVEPCTSNIPPTMEVTALISPTSIDVPGQVHLDIANFAIARTVGANTWSGMNGYRYPGVVDPLQDQTILCRSGNYTHDRLTSKEGRAGSALLRLVAEELGGAVMNPNRSSGGSQTFYPENWTMFSMEGWRFLGDDKAAVIYERPMSGRGFLPQLDHHFLNCVMDGGWNPLSATKGSPNQFGCLSYDTGGTIAGNSYGWSWVVDADSVPWGGGFREQYFYIHGVKAPGALIQGVRARWCGRSFIQMPARAGEVTLPMDGVLHVFDCQVQDVCLESGGGGSAIDTKGPLAELHIRGCDFSLGCTPGLANGWERNITGCLSVKANGLGHPARVIIEDSSMRVGQVFPGKDSARRVNVNIQEADEFLLLGTGLIQQFPGAFSVALAVQVAELDRLVLDDDFTVIGDVQVGDRIHKDPQLDGSGYRALLADLQADPPTGYSLEIR